MAAKGRCGGIRQSAVLSSRPMTAPTWIASSSVGAVCGRERALRCISHTEVLSSRPMTAPTWIASSIVGAVCGRERALRWGQAERGAFSAADDRSHKG